MSYVMILTYIISDITYIIMGNTQYSSLIASTYDIHLIFDNAFIKTYYKTYYNTFLLSRF